jgi:hypothetical protein
VRLRCHIDKHFAECCNLVDAQGMTRAGILVMTDKSHCTGRKDEPERRNDAGNVLEIAQVLNSALEVGRDKQRIGYVW